MNLLTLVMLMIGLLSVIGGPVLMYIYKRTYLDPLKKSMEWQLTKAEKIGNGWLPPAYRDFASEVERDEAMRNLLSDDGRPRR